MYSIQGAKLTVLTGRVFGLSNRNLRESVGCLVVWLLVQSLKAPITTLVRTYIEDRTDIFLHAIRPPPSILNSYPVDSIQCVKLTVSAGGTASCRIGTCGSLWGTWLVGRSFSHSRPVTQVGCTRRSLVRTYIDDVRTDTILYAI